MRIISRSSQETEEVGCRVGKKLWDVFCNKKVESKNSVQKELQLPLLCLQGDLGAGKTTLIRGIVQGLQADPKSVSSPTFTYLNIYQGSCPIFHFDLYRLKGVEEFLAMGFESFLEEEGVVCMEWSERIEEILPEFSPLHIVITHQGEGVRQIDCRGVFFNALSF